MSLFNNTINLNQIPVNVYGFTVTLLDAEDEPIQNATITGIDKVVTNDNDTNGSRELTSDENGQIKFFTNTGTVNITGATGLPGGLSSEDFKGTLRGYINKTVNYILGPNSTSNKYKYQITCKYRDGSLAKNMNVYASVNDYYSNIVLGTTNDNGVFNSGWIGNSALNVFFVDKADKLSFANSSFTGKLADTVSGTSTVTNLIEGNMEVGSIVIVFGKKYAVVDKDDSTVTLYSVYKNILGASKIYTNSLSKINSSNIQPYPTIANNLNTVDSSYYSKTIIPLDYSMASSLGEGSQSLKNILSIGAPYSSVTRGYGLFVISKTDALEESIRGYNVNILNYPDANFLEIDNYNSSQNNTIGYGIKLNYPGK